MADPRLRRIAGRALTVLAGAAVWAALHPRPDAPVWRTDGFRGRFLSAFASP